MRIQAHQLDRVITLQGRFRARNVEYGTWDTTWADFRRVAAQVQDVLPSRDVEGAEGGVLMARRQARVRTRWMDGVTSDMRILFDGRVMQIVSGPVEIGRRDGLEFMVEESSTEGEAP